MIASTLKKWRQNWRFLLAVTFVLFVVAGFAPIYTSQGDRLHLDEMPTLARALGWPLRDVAYGLGMEELLNEYWWATLWVFLWNAFLWATMLLEAKQVLARVLARRVRIRE